MQITDIPVAGYERVVRAKDPASGLHAIISVHDTTLGPALGGLRMWNYASEEEALFDVNRLSKGMSFKSAVAHTGLGGGKAVILGDPAKIKSEALYLAMGRFIEQLGGRYITAEDVNTDIADLEIIRRATKWVTGLERESGGSGNPSPYTAYGVFLGIEAAVKHKLGTDLRGVNVAVQGVGAVGSALVARLVDAGAKVRVADRNHARVQGLVDRLPVTAIDEKDVLTQSVEVFAPCALGAVLNGDTVPKLRCKIVAGAANNVLLAPEHGHMLRERGILYAPDYVINAGGIINVSCEFLPAGYDEKESLKRIERIPQALRELWQIGDREGIPANEAADRLALSILSQAKSVKQ
ncbi:MAG: Glu/Leu/Phe/Val dehydrogenase dimerization domain-containing protein [Planctomycetota bacterium]